MAGYAKLSQALVTSTVWRESSDTRCVWITMLALADKHGEVEGSVPGLADLSRVSVESCRKALDIFANPDPDSRTQDHGGRRIEALDDGRGWFILNYAKHRKLLDADQRRERDAERQRRSRANRAAAQMPVTPNVTQSHAPSHDVRLSSKQMADAKAEEAKLPQHTTREGLVEKFAHPDHRTAYSGLRRGQSVPEAWDRMLTTVHQPTTGGVGYDWPIIGAALIELQPNNPKPNAAAVRAFCRTIVRQGSQVPDAPANESPEAREARYKAEEDAQPIFIRRADHNIGLHPTDARYWHPDKDAPPKMEKTA